MHTHIHSDENALSFLCTSTPGQFVSSLAIVRQHFLIKVIKTNEGIYVDELNQQELRYVTL